MIKNYNLLILALFVYFGKIQAQASFGEQKIIQQLIGANSVCSSDIDGDGDQDVLSASKGDNKIAWYGNLDGQGTFGSQQIISIAALGATSVYAIDIDGDGDHDVLSASEADDKIAWYENINGKGSFGPQQIITTSADGAILVYASDIDGDGDQDVLSASNSDDKIAWYENIDGHGTFGTQQVISNMADGATSVYAIDVDGDGDQDVLSSSELDDKIAWYENTDGLGLFGSEKIITTSADGAKSVYSVDVDGDGDADVLSASWYDGKIAWYENIDGQGSFSTPHIITTSANNAVVVFTSDIDGDGDQDILTASSGSHYLAWYENTDGLGSFGPRQVITISEDGIKSFCTSDIDGDGDLDLLSASALWNGTKLTWYENTNALGSFSSQNIITTFSNTPRSLFTGDIDGDGDEDVLMATTQGDKIVWFENYDGLGTFTSEKIISTLLNSVRSVYAADIDGDNDLDVLSTSSGDDKVAWYENLDGKGTYGPQQVIGGSASSVYTTDIDGDNDQDILVCNTSETVYWLENTDGKGSFSTPKSFGDGSKVYSADIDGDGDQDVLTASISSGDVTWYENSDGKGTFLWRLTIPKPPDVYYGTSVFATDIDGDGDQDVLASFAHIGTVSHTDVVWYENIDGKGTFSYHIIIKSALGASSVYATDIDNDGDQDVLSTSAWDSKTAFYENTDGKGSFGSQQIITTNASVGIAVHAADIDGDGDQDVLTASINDSKIAWYENLIDNGLGDHNVVPSKFQIFPNPSSKFLNISSKLRIAKFFIYNSIGQVVLWKSDNMSVDISEIESGLYFIKIIDMFGDSETKKFIKR